MRVSSRGTAGVAADREWITERDGGQADSLATPHALATHDQHHHRVQDGVPRNRICLNDSQSENAEHDEHAQRPADCSAPGRFRARAGRHTCSRGRGGRSGPPAFSREHISSYGVCGCLLLCPRGRLSGARHPTHGGRITTLSADHTATRVIQKHSRSFPDNCQNRNHARYTQHRAHTSQRHSRPTREHMRSLLRGSCQ